MSRPFLSLEEEESEESMDINMQVQPPAVQQEEEDKSEAHGSSGYVAQPEAGPDFWYLPGAVSSLALPPSTCPRPAFSYRSQAAHQHLYRPPRALVRSIHTYDYTEEEADLTLEQTIQPVEGPIEEPPPILDAVSISRELELGFNLHDDDADDQFNPLAVELSANGADFQSELFELGQRGYPVEVPLLEGDLALEAGGSLDADRSLGAELLLDADISLEYDELLSPAPFPVLEFEDEPGPSGLRTHAVQVYPRGGEGEPQTCYLTNLPKLNYVPLFEGSMHRMRVQARRAPPADRSEELLGLPGTAEENEANSERENSGRHNSGRDNSERDYSERGTSQRGNSERDTSEPDNSERPNSERDTKRDTSERDSSKRDNSERDNSERDTSEHANSERDNSEREKENKANALAEALRSTATYFASHDDRINPQATECNYLEPEKPEFAAASSSRTPNEDESATLSTMDNETHSLSQTYEDVTDDSEQDTLTDDVRMIAENSSEPVQSSTETAENGSELDTRTNDSSEPVQSSTETAENGSELDTRTNDSSEPVQSSTETAENGSELDTRTNDSSEIDTTVNDSEQNTSEDSARYALPDDNARDVLLDENTQHALFEDSTEDDTRYALPDEYALLDDSTQYALPDDDNAPSAQPEDSEPDSSSEDNVPIAQLTAFSKQTKRSRSAKRKAAPAMRSKKTKKNVKPSPPASQTRPSKSGSTMVLRKKYT